MQTLDDLLAQRLSDLIGSEAALRKALGENLNEQQKVRLAANAAGVNLIEPRVLQTLALPTEPTGAMPFRRHPSLKTIKEAVVSVLNASLFGMTALEILEKIDTLHGMDYPRTSLSPQLSRLKNDGVIAKDGKIWRLVPPSAKKNEAPSANALEPQNIPHQGDQTGAVRSPEIGALE
jgi:hypothetical protein